MSRPCVIFNPDSGSAGSADDLRSVLAPLGEIDLCPITKAAGPEKLAEQAARDGCSLVIAAGGDGTINGVANGLLAGDGHAKLGVLPLGTGNDFARTLALPTDLTQAVAALVAGKTVKSDVVEVRSSDLTCHFINVSAGGFSGLVDEKLTDEMKASWGPLAYLRAAVVALPDMTNYSMRFHFDDESDQLIQAYNIVVANGRFVAGGWPVAPTAIIDDGLMDVIIVPVLPATKIGLLAPQLFMGQHINSDELIVRRARRFSVDSQPGMWFNVDGELVSNEPATFEVLPQRLEVIVGPEYERAPTA